MPGNETLYATRAAVIEVLRHQGLTYAQIGTRIGLSAERVRQILSRTELRRFRDLQGHRSPDRLLLKRLASNGRSIDAIEALRQLRQP